MATATLPACSRRDAASENSDGANSVAAAAAAAADAAAAEASAAAAAAEASPPPGASSPLIQGGGSYGDYVASHGTDDCTQDCSGHEAGYQWAGDNNITNADDCSGSSDSFVEGCKAYVEDNS